VEEKDRPKDTAAKPNLILTPQVIGMRCLIGLIILVYGWYGVSVDDVYIPGKYGRGLHVHGSYALLVAIAVTSGCIALMSTLADLPAAESWRKTGRTVGKMAAWFGWALGFWAMGASIFRLLPPTTLSLTAELTGGAIDFALAAGLAWLMAYASNKPRQLAPSNAVPAQTVLPGWLGLVTGVGLGALGACIAIGAALGLLISPTISPLVVGILVIGIAIAGWGISIAMRSSNRATDTPVTKAANSFYAAPVIPVQSRPSQPRYRQWLAVVVIVLAGITTVYRWHESNRPTYPVSDYQRLKAVEHKWQQSFSNGKFATDYDALSIQREGNVLRVLIRGQALNDEGQEQLARSVHLRTDVRAKELYSEVSLDCGSPKVLLRGQWLIGEAGQVAPAYMNREWQTLETGSDLDFIRQRLCDPTAAKIADLETEQHYLTVSLQDHDWQSFNPGGNVDTSYDKRSVSIRDNHLFVLQRGLALNTVGSEHLKKAFGFRGDTAPSAVFNEMEMQCTGKRGRLVGHWLADAEGHILQSDPVGAQEWYDFDASDDFGYLREQLCPRGGSTNSP